MSECPHKQLKKQMVGEFVYYACECGQKFRAWDGKVSVLAPPDPRKDLALDELVAKWREGLIATPHGDMKMLGGKWVGDLCADELEQRLGGDA